MMWRFDGGTCPFCGSGAGWGAGGLLMLFFGLLVLVGIVLLIVWAVRQGSAHTGPRETYAPPGAQHVGTYPPSHGATPAEDAAVAAARHRFARGEIDREELERILTALRENR